jgi:opacity protein-like surface antigen
MEGRYAYTGSGDISGTPYNAEVGRQLINRISPAIGVGYMRFRGNQDDVIVQDADALSLDLHGYVDIFNDEDLDIEVGGGFYRYWQRGYATGPTIGLRVKGIHVASGSYEEIRYNSVGYSAAIGVKVKVTGNVKLSVRCVYQNDSQGDNALSARGGVILKFK